jgi:hypothetical protein
MKASDTVDTSPKAPVSAATATLQLMETLQAKSLTSLGDALSRNPDSVFGTVVESLQNMLHEIAEWRPYIEEFEAYQMRCLAVPQRPPKTLQEMKEMDDDKRDLASSDCFLSTPVQSWLRKADRTCDQLTVSCMSADKDYSGNFSPVGYTAFAAVSRGGHLFPLDSSGRTLLDDLCDARFRPAEEEALLGAMVKEDGSETTSTPACIE